MSQQYREEDGMDPGLGDLAYDGTEYELDEFGERITDNDLDDDMPEEAMSEDDMSPASNIEDGFGETLNADSNPHLNDQFDDEQLKDAAESDYNESDAPRS